MTAVLLLLSACGTGSKSKADAGEPGTSGDSNAGDASVTTDASIANDGAADDAAVARCPDPNPAPEPSPLAACADTLPDATGDTQVSLIVDASASLGAWNRFYEGALSADHANTLLCTVWNRNILNALRTAHDQAGFQYVRFHGILDDDIGVYSEDANGQPIYRWARFDAVYDTIQAAGMKPIFEVDFMPSAMASDPSKVLPQLWYANKSPNISPPKDWNRWVSFMTDIVRHLEDRYGADEVRSWYFEIWNEPSWMYSLGDTEYPTLYRATSKGLIAGDSQIRVGGPAGSSGESPGAIASILQLGGLYQTRVDFISYHRYADDSGGAVADANGMLAFHRQMASLVSSWHFAGQLLNDEFGPSWTPDVSRDTEVAASFIAKTIHLIGSDTVAPPPTTYGYWAVSDLYEEINTGSALAYREGNFGLMLKGDPKIPASYDVPKPSFNAFRLLHMMSDTSLAVAGGTSDDGVNAAATMSSDQSAVQVLVYHHVTGGAADSSQSSVVALNVDHLPFADGPVRVRQYLVDAAHANSHTAWVAMQKPAQPTADQWATLRSASDLCYYESSATVAGGSLSLTFPQSIYGIRLVELRP